MAGWTPPVGAMGCSDGPQVGTSALAVALLGTYGPLGAVSQGIFNCRKIGGSDRWSLHAEGRAFDLGVGWPPSALGDQVLEQLLEVPGELYLQRVIYNRHLYDVQSPRGRPFNDGDPHTTHLHIEQSWAGAHDLTESVAILALVPPDTDEDEPMVLLRQLDHPTSTTYWLLAGGKRIYLANYTNVMALRDAGAATIALPDHTLALIPEVR